MSDEQKHAHVEGEVARCRSFLLIMTASLHANAEVLTSSVLSGRPDTGIAAHG